VCWSRCLCNSGILVVWSVLCVGTGNRSLAAAWPCLHKMCSNMLLIGDAACLPTLRVLQPRLHKQQVCSIFRPWTTPRHQRAVGATSGWSKDLTFKGDLLYRMQCMQAGTSCALCELYVSICQHCTPVWPQRALAFRPREVCGTFLCATWPSPLRRVRRT
jgi:hypothetical protein